MVIALPVVGPAVLFEAGALGHVELAPHQGLDPLGFGCVIELDGAVEVAVVRQRQGVHPQSRGPVHQAVNPAGSVEEAVVAMDMKMDEARVGRHSPSGKASRASAQAWKPIAAKKPLTPCSRFGVFQTFYPHKPDRPLMSIEIKIRKNEPVDRALRRMKKKLDRENIIKGVRAKRYYEKPCEKRRRKDKVQAFTQMLRRRYAE